MKRLLLLLLSTATIPSFAYFNYNNFQQFDNQVSFGINSQHGNFNSVDGAGHNNDFNALSLNLEVEKLFDIGLWLDVNAGTIQTYTQSNSPTNPLGGYPFLTTMNAKLGYNIPFTNYFSMTPYFLLGKNSNVTSFTGIVGGVGQNVGITNDYFYTLGFGARFEFPINKYVDVYFDQLYASNQDQTQYPSTTDVPFNVSASNTQYTSTLGVKVNVVKNLQLSANAFYTMYTDYNQQSQQYLASDPANGLNGVPTNAVGVQAAVGFTFK